MQRYNKVISKKEQRYQRQKLKERQALQGLILQPIFSIQNSSTARFFIFLMLTAQFLMITEGAKTNLKPEKYSGENKNLIDSVKTADNSQILTVELPPTYIDQQTIISTHSITSTKKASICQDTIFLGEKNINVRCSTRLFIDLKKNPKEYKQAVETLKEIVRGASTNKASLCKMESISNGQGMNIELTTVMQAPSGVRAAYDKITNSIRFPINIKLTPNIVSVFEHEIHHYFWANQNRKLRRNYIVSLDNSAAIPYDQSKPKNADRLQGMINEGLKNIRDNLVLLDLNELFKSQTYQYDPTLMIKSHYQTVASRYSSNIKLTTDESALLNKLYESVEYYAPLTISLVKRDEQIPPLLEKKYIDKDYNLLVNFQTSAESGYGNEFDVHVIATEKIDSQSVRFFANTVSKIDTPHQKLKAALLDGYHTLQSLPDLYSLDKSSDLIAEADAFIHQIYGNYSSLFQLLFPRLLKHHKTVWDEPYQNCLKR